MSNILRPKELTELLNISMSTLYEWQHRPDFSQKIQLGKQSVGWFEHEIREWLESQKIDKTK